LGRYRFARAIDFFEQCAIALARGGTSHSILNDTLPAIERMLLLAAGQIARLNDRVRASKCLLWIVQVGTRLRLEHSDINVAIVAGTARGDQGAIA
jgi:hypothetical protein